MANVGNHMLTKSVFLYPTPDRKKNTSEFPVPIVLMMITYLTHRTTGYFDDRLLTRMTDTGFLVA